MRFRWSCHIVFGLFFLLQLSNAGPRKADKEELFLLQQKVENLIEKIINYIHDYYYTIHEDVKCLPECVVEDLMETLKRSIDCVDENEKNLNTGLITGKMHSKNFLKCFSDAKIEVRDTMNSINTSLDYCPDDITEKTYQINITTTFTKTFNINIKNGLEITKKEIELRKHEKHYFDHKRETDDVFYSDYEDLESPEQPSDDQNQEIETATNLNERPDNSEETRTTFNPEEGVRGKTQNSQPNQEKVTEQSELSVSVEEGDNQEEHYENEYSEHELEVGNRRLKTPEEDELGVDNRNMEKLADDGEDNFSRYVYMEKN